MAKSVKIVFDFDGTLADSWGEMVKVLKEFRPEIGQNELNVFREYGAARAIKKLNLSLREVLVMMVKVNGIMKKSMDKVKPFVGIKELLENLRERKIEIGILTSNNKSNIEEWLKINEIKVDWVVAERTLLSKDKKIKRVADENTVYVGDEVRDIEACQRIGVPVVAVTWGVNSKKALIEAKPDYLAESVRDLEKSLLTLSQ